MTWRGRVPPVAVSKRRKNPGGSEHTLTPDTFNRSSVVVVDDDVDDVDEAVVVVG